MAGDSAADERVFIELKNAYSSGKLPQTFRKFNISTIITYFLHTHSDFRSIREVSYELYTNGHVRVSTCIIPRQRKLIFIPIHLRPTCRCEKQF